MKRIKIKRKTEVLDRIPTYDLTVKDSHHYFLEDGTVSHNTQDFISRQIAGGGTGPQYAASIVLMLNKAQLKDGADKVGIIVTAKPDKNRFAKPTPIKFHLNFSEGMNPYVGLEHYATWDICGITKGTIEKGKKVPKATARGWICEHLDEVVPNKEFFTAKVFTQEVLERIEKHIQPIFNYNSETSSIDIEEMLNETESAE